MVVRKADSLHLRPGVAEGAMAMGGGGYADGASLSGHERNHLFLNAGGTELIDVSGVSGLDDPSDGRAVAWTDFDRDGWIDFVVANANAPAFQLYRNEIGAVAGSAGNRAIGIRLVGGNQDASPTNAWSNRDGIGARIEIDIDGRTLVRELRAGEGFASQNSSSLLIGIGESESARVRIHWPSGRSQSVGEVRAGTQVTLRERADQPAAVDRAPIDIRTADPEPEKTRASQSKEATLRLSSAFGTPSAPVRILLTTATWCEACRGELPDAARLREMFEPDEIEILAIPTDPSDTAEMLRDYVNAHTPEYRMIYDRTATDIAQVQRIITETLRREVLPASIVTDGQNRILGVYWGLPTVSELRALNPGTS